MMNLPEPLPPNTPRPMPTMLWVYRARLARVIDGDTIDVVCDAGFHAHRTERLRLLLANTPETRGATLEEGRAATRFTAAWLTQHGAEPGSEGWPLRIQTEKSDVFGRYLAWVFAADDGSCLNDELLASGHAVVYERR